MHGHCHSKHAKKLNDKIPKTVDEMFERARAFIRGEMAAGSAKMKGYFHSTNKNSKGNLGHERDREHNTNDCYQLKKHIEEAVASSKLAHLVKDIYRSNQKSGNQKRNDVKGVVTMETIMETLWECTLLEKMLGLWDETQWLQHMEQMLRILEQALLGTRNYPGQRSGKEPMLLEKREEK
ncbi:hypothetical protein Tco_1547531 [Tanacetum coccineum]